MYEDKIIEKIFTENQNVMTKDEFVKAIQPRLIDLGELNIFKKKDDHDSEHEHGNDKNDCEKDSIDYGDGPAEWIFSPDKLRPLYRHGQKTFKIEIKEDKAYIQDKLRTNIDILAVKGEVKKTVNKTLDSAKKI